MQLPPDSSRCHRLRFAVYESSSTLSSSAVMRACVYVRAGARVCVCILVRVPVFMRVGVLCVFVSVTVCVCVCVCM
jgi:hypothetical protein